MEMRIDWTPIILAILAMINTVLTGFLIPYFRALTVEKRRENLDYWVQVVVTHIEKSYTARQIGEFKKDMVTDIIQDMKLKVTDIQLSMLIDEVVERIINKPRLELQAIREIQIK